MSGGGVVVQLAERHRAPALAELHLRTALAGYGHIFPPEAPAPTYDEVLAQWEHWLGPDWDAGRRAFVAASDGDDSADAAGDAAVFGVDAGGDNAVLGVVLAGPDPADADVGHLARLYVTPPRWATGIGRLLHDAALDHLRAAGFSLATLWVLERNDRARSWYERLGWEPTGETKPVYAPAGIVDLRYRLRLRQ